MSIKIESGIPVPPQRSKVGGYKYPWLQMEVGDSFACPEDTSEKAFRNSAYGASFRHAPRKFSVSVANGALRCWRVA